MQEKSWKNKFSTFSVLNELNKCISVIVFVRELQHAGVSNTIHVLCPVTTSSTVLLEDLRVVGSDLLMGHIDANKSNEDAT